MHIGILLSKDINSLLQIVGTLIYRQLFLLKQRLRTLLTIIHDFARFLQPIDMVGTEGEESDTESDSDRIAAYEGRGGGHRGSQQALEGVEDGGWIVHYAEGVHHSAELLLLEALAYPIGKARAHEEHLFAGTYLKVRLLNIDNRPKLHNPKL